MSAETLAGVQKIERLTGDGFNEGLQIQEGIHGIIRALQRRPEFLASARDAGLDPQRLSLTKPWIITFPVESSVYSANHDGGLINEIGKESIVLERTNAGSSNKGTLVTLSDDVGIGHVHGSASVITGENAPSTGMKALVDL